MWARHAGRHSQQLFEARDHERACGACAWALGAHPCRTAWCRIPSSSSHRCTRTSWRRRRSCCRPGRPCTRPSFQRSRRTCCLGTLRGWAHAENARIHERPSSGSLAQPAARSFFQRRTCAGQGGAEPGAVKAGRAGARRGRRHAGAVGGARTAGARERAAELVRRAGCHENVTRQGVCA